MREPGSVTPSPLTFPDSEPIASVTLEPDAEPPVVSATGSCSRRSPDAGSRWWAWRWAWPSSASPSPGSNCWAARRQHPRRCPRRQRCARGGPAGDRRHRAGASATDPRGPGGAAAGRQRRRRPRKPRPWPPRHRPRRPRPCPPPSLMSPPRRGRPRRSRTVARHGPPQRQAASAPRGAGAEGRHAGAGCEAQRDDDARRRPSAAIRAPTTSVATRCCSPGTARGPSRPTARRYGPLRPTRAPFAASGWRTSSSRSLSSPPARCAAI